MENTLSYRFNHTVRNPSLYEAHDTLAVSAHPPRLSPHYPLPPYSHSQPQRHPPPPYKSAAPPYAPSPATHAHPPHRH